MNQYMDWIRIKNLKKLWYNQFQKSDLAATYVWIYTYSEKLNCLIRDNENEDSILIKDHKKMDFVIQTLKKRDQNWNSSMQLLELLWLHKLCVYIYIYLILIEWRTKNDLENKNLPFDCFLLRK